MLHIRGNSEGCEELLGVGLVLGEVEERRLRLGLGEEPEVKSVQAEPVRHPDAVILMSIGLGNLRVNVIVNDTLVNLSRGHLSMIDLEYRIQTKYIKQCFFCIFHHLRNVDCLGECSDRVG